MEGIGERHRDEFHKGMGDDSRLLVDDTFIDKVLGQERRKKNSISPWTGSPIGDARYIVSTKTPSGSREGCGIIRKRAVWPHGWYWKQDAELLPNWRKRPGEIYLR